MTKKTTVPATCTVDVAQCHGLLTDVLRCADTDPCLPMINGVLLHGDEHEGHPVLVATATDRFKLAHAHIDATGTPLGEVFVRVAEVKRLLAVLKALPKDSTLLEISSNDVGDVVFSARGASATLEHYDLGNGGFIEYSKLFASLEKAQSQERIAVSGPNLEAIVAVAKRRREAIRFEAHGKAKPAGVFVGDRYRALIMPMRLGDDVVTDSPLFVPPGQREKQKAA
ncbi:hypothetical protein [Amycolatopsis sp. NPDC001319]|uniref:hypothetical protein n=1 Tax=unclassified Amycolatopsis TaxID=2618356 RepID=UPI0036B7EEE1